MADPEIFLGGEVGGYVEKCKFHTLEKAIVAF